MATDDEPGTAAERREARGLVAVGKGLATDVQSRANATLDQHRHRPLVDVALRIVRRDREAAGAVVGSAVAFRLFLFFVPLLLALVGLAGFVANNVSPEHIDDAGISGNLADQMSSALSQPTSTRWIATLTGLVGMVSAGRTLSKTLTQASCLAWGLPLRAKASVRVVGSLVGVMVGIGLVAVGVNRIRQSLGLGVTGLSFLVAVGMYVVAWLVVFALLPRATSDPGALLPGAALVALTFAGLQAVSQLYLPDRFSRASQLYGAIGSTIVALGWFFFAGRAIVLGMTVNAAVYERFGSVSQPVFALPVLRRLPPRWPWLRRTFQLET